MAKVLCTSGAIIISIDARLRVFWYGIDRLRWHTHYECTAQMQDEDQATGQDGGELSNRSRQS